MAIAVPMTKQESASTIPFNPTNATMKANTLVAPTDVTIDWM